MNEVKPEKLYRGIVLDYEELKNVVISDTDMYPPYEAEINEDGRKVVGDGNEYGVYMSDNKLMVLSAYSNPDGRGTNIGGNIRVGIYDSPIEIPKIGIAYEITAEGLDIREPWIRTELTGVYNNGFQGKEWIADYVPRDKYKVIRARIGGDLLHDAEDLSLEDTSSMKEELLEKVQGRKARLEAFRDDISGLSINQRRDLNREKLELLKLFYGENGAKYLEESQIDVLTPEGVMKKILKTSLHDADGKIDLDALNLYCRIWGNFKLEKDSQSVDMLKSKFEEAIEREMTSRNRFVERKKEQGEEADTTNFDRRVERLRTAVGIFDSKERKGSSSLIDEAVNLGIDTGVRTETMLQAEKVITPTKEEKSKTV